MAKKQSRFLFQQKAALTVFGLLLVGIIGYLGWVALEEAPLGEFVEGEHYQLIDDPRRVRGDRIEVMEFFSYACVHCYNFDPILEDWVEARSAEVSFTRMPAVASEYWRLLARAYYTLEELDALEARHMAFFRAIHESRMTFPTPESIFDYAEEQGLDRQAFESAYRSTPVNASINRADQMARRMKVSAVPTIVVQGKYIVRTTRSIGPKRMLEVMDYLVELERGQAEAAE